VRVQSRSTRQASPLVTWLTHHSGGIHVICHDQAKEFARGANPGAPEVLHIADRFHVLHTLTETVERVLPRHCTALEHIPLAPSSAPSPSMLSRYHKPDRERQKQRTQPILGTAMKCFSVSSSKDGTPSIA